MDFLGISWTERTHNPQQLIATCSNQNFSDIFIDRISIRRNFR